MDGIRLSHQNIYCGVPQGSILGPLLYFIYVNEICKSCKSNISSFADDTTIYLSNSDLNVLYTEANIENYDIYLINTRLSGAGNNCSESSTKMYCYLY